MRPPAGHGSAGGVARTPRVVCRYNSGGTTPRGAGCTIAAVGFPSARPVSPWVRPVAMAAVVEFVTVAGSVFARPNRGRPVDALGVVAFSQRWPVQSLSASLLCTAGYYALGYHTDSSFFIGLLVTGYRSGTADARVRAAGFMLLTAALFAAGSRLGRPVDTTSAL